MRRTNESKYGGIAQLGERLNGIQEVSGSIPLISTISWKVKKKKLVLETKRAFFISKGQISISKCRSAFPPGVLKLSGHPFSMPEQR